MDIVDAELAAVAAAERSMTAQLGIFHSRLSSIATHARKVKASVVLLERALSHLDWTHQELDIAQLCYVTPPVVDDVIRKNNRDVGAICDTLQYCAFASTYLTQTTPENVVSQRLKVKVVQFMDRSVAIAEETVLQKATDAMSLVVAGQAGSGADLALAVAAAAAAASDAGATTTMPTTVPAGVMSNRLVLRHAPLGGIAELVLALWSNYHRLACAAPLLARMKERILEVLLSETDTRHREAVWGGAGGGRGGGDGASGANSRYSSEQHYDNESRSRSNSQQSQQSLRKSLLASASAPKRRYAKASSPLLVVSQRARMLVAEATAVFSDLVIEPLAGARGSGTTVDRSGAGRQQMSALVVKLVLDVATMVFGKVQSALDGFGRHDAFILLSLDLFDEAWKWCFTSQRVRGTGPLLGSQLVRDVHSLASKLRRDVKDSLREYRVQKGELQEEDLIGLVAAEIEYKDEEDPSAGHTYSDDRDALLACFTMAVRMLLGLSMAAFDNLEGLSDGANLSTLLPLDFRLSWLPSPDSATHESTTEVVSCLRALVRDYAGPLCFALGDEVARLTDDLILNKGASSSGGGVMSQAVAAQLGYATPAPAASRLPTFAHPSASASVAGGGGGGSAASVYACEDPVMEAAEDRAMTLASEYLAAVLSGHLSDLMAIATAARKIYSKVSSEYWRMRFHRPFDSALAHDFGTKLFMINNVNYIVRNLREETAAAGARGGGGSSASEIHERVVPTMLKQFDAQLSDLIELYVSEEWEARLPPIDDDAILDAIDAESDRPLSHSERMHVKEWHAAFTKAVDRRIAIETRRLITDQALRTRVCAAVRAALVGHYMQMSSLLAGRAWSDRPQKWMPQSIDALGTSLNRMFCG